MSRFSHFSQRSGTDHHFLAPQAGPSRISSQPDAFSVLHDDEDNQATPRVTARPPVESYADATPTQSANEQTGVARLRAIMALQNQQQQQQQQSQQSIRRPSPPRSTYAASDMESDFESPHATVSHSIHMERFKDLFAKVHADMTPPGKRTGVRRNSIDTSEVEDSPRVERVQEERAKYKGKRKSVSDEEAEAYASTYSPSRSPLWCY